MLHRFVCVIIIIIIIIIIIVIIIISFALAPKGRFKGTFRI